MVSKENVKLLKDMQRCADEFLKISYNKETYIPNFANVGFACELYLKTLLQLKKNEYGHKHDLLELYKDVKDCISMVDFLDILKNKMFAGNLGIDVEEELQRMLNKHKNIFVDFRYYFELPEDNDMKQFFELINLFKKFTDENNEEKELSISSFADKLKKFSNRYKETSNDIINKTLSAFAEKLKVNNSVSSQKIDLIFLNKELNKALSEINSAFDKSENFMLENQELSKEKMDVTNFWKILIKYGFIIKGDKPTANDYSHYILFQFSDMLSNFKLTRPTKERVNVTLSAFAEALKEYTEQLLNEVIPTS